MSRYAQGTDVLGAGILDMIPGLGAISSLTSGGGSTPAAGATSQADAIKKALEEERSKQAAAKAQAQAAQTRLLMFAILGVLGVGGAVWFLKR